MSKQKFKYDLRKVGAFLYALHKEGIYCKRGKCRAYFDGEIFVLEDRKTKEPLFAAIPLY